MEQAHGTDITSKRWRRQNRRVHQRAELSTPIQSMQNGRLARHTCQNISEGGMRLRTERALRTGSQIKLFVPIPIPYNDRNRLHLLEAEVVWSDGQQAGLRFLDAPMEISLDVRSFVKWAA